MTRAEVEGILGPPGDYATGKVTVKYETMKGPSNDVWAGDTLVIYIHFDGSVASTVQCTPAGKYNQSPLDKLLWRLRRPFRKWFPEQEVRE
jgi:hypothetical protein